MLQLTLLLLSGVCAGLPMLLFLSLVWWLDRYDREPLWLLAVTFLWGAVGAVGIAIVGGSVLDALVQLTLSAADRATPVDLSPWAAAISPTIVAPSIEEPAKAAILLAVIFNRHFDNMTDGFVYGAATGLGFGMTENFLYFAGTTDDVIAWSATVFIRTFYSAVMHALATSIVGAALGLGRFRGTKTLILAGSIGMMLALMVHGLWNGLISLGEVGLTTNLFWLDLVLFPLEVLLVAIVFEICVLDESRTIRRELEDEAASGHIPEHHPRIVASWFRRLGRRWLAQGIDRKAYVLACTTLAMRKRQIRQMGQAAPAAYRQEVEELRRYLVSAHLPQQQPPRGRTT